MPLDLDSDPTQGRKACCADLHPCGPALNTTTSEKGGRAQTSRSVENRDPIASRRLHVRTVRSAGRGVLPSPQWIAVCDVTTGCLGPGSDGDLATTHRRPAVHDVQQALCRALLKVLTGLPSPRIYVRSISRACETAVNLVSMQIAHHQATCPVPSGRDHEVLRPARTDRAVGRSWPALRVIAASANRHEPVAQHGVSFASHRCENLAAESQCNPGHDHTGHRPAGLAPFCSARLRRNFSSCTKSALPCPDATHVPPVGPFPLARHGIEIKVGHDSLVRLTLPFVSTRTAHEPQRTRHPAAVNAAVKAEDI
jgi:hypothetical protein